ncbi:MAG TPA: hypothetical protein VLV86_14250 [Vicinamibacterales bacterium]|nr:hypothetical protein [Vicinamibacterales bacterium]
MPLHGNRRLGDTPDVKTLYEALCRYAGWLNRERNSRLVRTDVESLGTAIETNSDPRPHLEKLEANLVRLPGGDVRTMIRKIVVQLRQAFEETEL